MANNTGYQSTWTGSLPTNQVQPVQPMIPSSTTIGQPQFGDNGQMQQPTLNNQFMPTQQMQPWPVQAPVPDSPLFIATVPSDEVVNSYPVARGVTAFLINYNEGVFWTKRQTDDGLGYKTVRHYFQVDDQNQPRRNQNGCSVTDEAFALLNERVDKLRHDFDEFIK